MSEGSEKPSVMDGTEVLASDTDAKEPEYLQTQEQPVKGDETPATISTTSENLGLNLEASDEVLASNRSLIGSTSRIVTPSTSVGMSVPHSPQSSISRGRRGTSRQHSVLDKLSQCSSLNLSIHREGSLEKINEDNSDDSFHQPTQTVISPLNQPQTQPNPIPIHPRMSGRFTVSPAQSIPMSVTARHKVGNLTPTKSESSYTMSLGQQEPDMQFKMSDTSLPQFTDKMADRPENQRALLTDYEIVSIELKDQAAKEENHVGDHLGDFDDFLAHVDENQRTVQSCFSINTQDSAMYEHATLQCGNIRFLKDSAKMAYEPKKHYLCVGYDTKMPAVTEFMARYWGKKNPNIVLSVISSEENYKPWKNQRLKDDFQKGILKAANTTDMWIITNGIDAGIPKVIGDAIKEYNIEQQNSRLITNPLLWGSELRNRRLTAIGIVPKDTVPYGMYFDGTEGVQITNYGGKAHVYELNPDHTHFIMVEEDGREWGTGNLRCLIENQFRNKLIKKRRPTRLMSIGSDTEHEEVTESKEDSDNFIPVVGLLVQGSPKNIDHVLFYLQNKMPVVVLKGSGGLADMIGYVYEEMQEKAESDPDYEEHILKPELIKMIVRVYGSYFEDNELEKFILRDKIIQCVKTANEGDGDTSFMTVVNMKGWGSCMKDLDKYILRALFKYFQSSSEVNYSQKNALKRKATSKKASVKQKDNSSNQTSMNTEKHETIGLLEQLQNDLQLTIDWNRPDLAWEIFQQDFTKVRIDKKMFEKALLHKDREEFIELFLSQGVKVHKFLNHKKLKLLFEKAEDREFFVNVCLEGVLGITMLPDQPLDDNFLSESLNRLIYKLSWIRNFIQPYELSMSSTGLYTVDSTLAERKAINSLMIWAVLMNRHKLAKTLWSKCDEPIGVALICSRINRELSKYQIEQYQKLELEENAKEFGKMALGALAICWRDSSIQAYHMLGKRLPDFNNKSTVEIAHDAGYIHFLAHPCCQKWLTQKFHGHLQIKELDWGVGRLPQWFKILVSVFFIFPMYIWISFIPPSKKKTTAGVEEDNGSENSEHSDSDEEDEMLPHFTKSTIENIMNKKKTTKLTSTLKSVLSFKPKVDVPFHQKIYLLWTAPITKFWTTQVFYFAFLGLFCLATLWPTCGNQAVDMILWFWAAVIEMELVCRVYRKYHKYKTLSLLGNCIDILLIMAFLVLLLLTRIMQTWISLGDYIQARIFMCFGLIYFFYRLLGVYLPISPTLGPMLLRINRMVKRDFVAFVRMFLIFMIAGGVTIQAVLYPHWPLTTELVKRVLTRPIYAMFLTQVDDLDGNPTCSPSYKNTSEYCHATQVYSASSYIKQEPIIEKLQRCPVSSLSAYVITLQYLLICKLVLVTLLFAMFALTIAKVDEVASEIWKFQRYALIADFIERFSLPPPFTIFSFLYLFLKFIYKKCKRCKKKYRCCIASKNRRLSRYKSTARLQNKIDDTEFWKKVAREYVSGQEAIAEKETMATKQGDILAMLQEDLRTHRKSMKRLNDRVVELERMMQSSRLYLEDIAHKLEKSDVMGITNVKGKFIHIAARQSPYPSTNLTRFPVFDKYVPWENQYDVYDPKTYTLSKDKFPENEIMYVDEDMIELIRLQEERLAAGTEEEDRLTPLPIFKPKWNTVTAYKEKGEKREIDRRSWININDQQLRYTVDFLGVPQNPMGRTGLRGKGILWRWGPNHVIKAVITRWRRKYGPDLNSMTDFLYVEGKRVLEFIAVQKDSFMDSSYALPGDILHGLSNPYSIVCRAFMSQVFDEQDNGLFNKFDQSEMIQFFSQFASVVAGGSSSRTSFHHETVMGSSLRSSYSLQPFMSESRSNLKTETDPQGFCASLLYKGYLDDPRNTDNAWVEAEVWNFHYDIGDTFDLRLSEGMTVKWKEVSPYVKMFGNESVIVQEAARIHDAYH